MNKQTKAILASYARSAIAAAVAVYSTGNTDPQDWLKAAVAALIPVVMRWANPHDPAYGRGK
jgi:ABC-type branched-subunit amino acid transport system substrate-binding protein